MIDELNQVPCDILRDMQAVANGDLSPELLKRVAERSQRVQSELLTRFGVCDIAVDLIRQVRDEE